MFFGFGVLLHNPIPKEWYADVQYFAPKSLLLMLAVYFLPFLLGIAASQISFGTFLMVIFGKAFYFVAIAVGACASFRESGWASFLGEWMAAPCFYGYSVYMSECSLLRRILVAFCLCAMISCIDFCIVSPIAVHMINFLINMR